ncbi:MAG: TetR-like C-terminal domain-containing protein [Rhodobacteraceae bacterium]|nr:TetR-like C-terminal domain-containing protein [Paracoccaceae bacterium]
MAAAGEKSYHHGDLKQALVEAGIAELEEKGLELLSLRSIAARVGVSHTAPKNHFDGLRGLRTAIAAEGFRRHALAMRAGLEGEPSGKSRLDAACNGYVRFALENPELFKLMFSSVLCNYEDIELQRACRTSYEILRGVAHGLDWDKAQQPGGPWRTEWMLWSMVHGYAMLLIQGQISRNKDGSLMFDVVGLMPDFGYRTDAATSLPEPFTD